MRAVIAPLSYGEAADKISILTIKSEWLGDPGQRANVARELTLLRDAFFATITRDARFDALYDALIAVNRKLWVIENDIRACEARGDFGGDFVALARAVYRNNDERARLKREINKALGSDLIEEKSYDAGSDDDGRS
jgi:hypothetical protein